MMYRRDFLKLSPMAMLSACFTPQPTQAAESAGVPGFVDVREYGEVGKGRTIQLALDDGLPNLIGNRTGKTFIIPRGEWLIDEPLRINQRADLRIIGAGRSVVGTVLRLQAPIEVIGANRITFESLYAKGEGVDVGFVTARTPGWLNSSQITFRDVECYGNYLKAAWYCVGSEMNHWENCNASIYYPNESCVTIAGNNVLGVQTSLPISDGYGVYNPYLHHTNLMGDVQVPLRVYGTHQILEDVYLYCRNGRASIEMIGGGSLVMRNCGFEGTPFATIRVTSLGNKEVFNLDIETATFGAPAEYEIWADDGTKMRNSRIWKKANGKGMRFYGIETSDLTGLAVNDWREWHISAASIYASKIGLGPKDVLDCPIKARFGVIVENWGEYKIEKYGFVE